MKNLTHYFSGKKAWLPAVLLSVISITGFAQTNFYVSPLGNDANSGLSPATAKLTIQNAVNTAAAGDIVNLDPGTYTARITITKPLTLQGVSEAACILSGTGLAGTGKGILINNGVTNVTIRQLTVQNFAGSNGNVDAGIYAPGGNNNLRIEHVTIQNNVGGSGFYANGPVDNVVLDYVTSSGHTTSARGIVIWNGLKNHITITNCQVFNNNCCGIELQDGSASGVTMSNNNVYNNADNGMSAIGLSGSVGANAIANNTLTDNGRFGIEIKNPDGNTTVSGNTVSRTLPFAAEVRDGAGISIYRRGVLGTNVDVPTGVKVLNNTVSGYVQPSTSEGFGIVVEGTNHTVTGNNVSGCDVGIQQQAGNLPYPADGDQNNKVDTYFGRGNGQVACGNLINANIFGGNGINTRNSGTVGGSGFIINTTTGKTYCSIQSAINDPQTLAGHTLELTGGIFNEQVLVNKSIAIKGVGASQPVVNFTGVPGAGKKTVFDISAANVTLDNLNIKVDLTKLSSAVIASGPNISNLSLKNNKIEAYGSGGAASIGTFGDRNAVSINYTGSTNYRVAPGGVNNISFTGNTVSGVANDGFGQSRFFRSGVSTDESGGVYSGNTIQSISQDILVRFGSNGNITITNNQFNGGGVELSDMNAGAGILTVSGNGFNAAFANIAATGAAVLRLRNNYNAKTTLVNANSFFNHEWAVSMENYNTVTVDNNTFTPLAGSTTYHHVTINTKSISTNSASIVQKPVGAVITKNIFNGSGAAGGTALSFHNHDNDAASFGSFVVGGAGNENDFNAGIGNIILLDNQTGSSNAAIFPAYSSVIGSGAGALTTMAAWTTALNAQNNRFDMGNGLELPAVMSLPGLFSLEDKVQHKTDAAALGFVTIKANNDYVTVNSFLAPATTASVQRGVDAAANGFTVNVGAGTFADNILVNKQVQIKGQGQASTKIIPAVSNPNCGGSGGGSICAGGSNVFLVQANNVTISQLTIDGDNPLLNSGTTVGGADIDARNGIITNHVAGVYTNLDVNHVTVQNIFLRGVYASSGGSFNFSDNIVSNIKGNTSSIGLFNFGGAGSFTNNTVNDANDAIASNWSKGSVYSGNTVTNSGSGIHTDNNGGQGGIADVIQNNQVSNSAANGYGIWVFAPYVAAQVKDNTVSNVDVGLAAAGQQSAVTATFSGNTVDGQNKPNSTGVYVTTDLFGFGSSNVSASFSNNIIRNNADGFYLESEAGNSLLLDAHNNSLSGNTNSNVTQGVGAGGAGSFSANMECNWWGTASAAAIAASISGAAVDHDPWLSGGADNDLAAGFQPAGTCATAITNAQVTATANVQCPGSSTGSATISFDNGFAGYTYSVDGGSAVNISGSPFTVNSLAAGTHTVTITDGGGNTTSASITITEPSAIAVNFTFTPILCNGGLSTQNVTITGGTAPYTVTNQGGGAFVIGALSGVTYGGNTFAANYVYTVTDANGCQYVFNADITQPAPITVSYSATPILCNGGLSTENITINGGTAPYTVTNQGGGALVIGAASGVTYHGNTYAANYVYTVTDANGCQYVFTANIPEPAVLLVSSSATPVVCNGSSTITVTAGGGTAPYNGTGTFNVPAGTYTYTVTDANGCSASTTITPAVTIDNIPPTITAPAPYSMANNPGQCGRTIANIGTPVTADNCAVASVTNDHPSAYYPVGTTIVTWKVTDTQGNVTDTAKQSVTVIDNEWPVLSLANQSFCTNAGGNYAIPVLTATDNCGIASVSYTITGATARSGPGSNASGSFNPGVSTINWTVKDVHGNTTTGSTTVTITALPAVAITAGNADAFCNKLTLTASSAGSGATYKWLSGSSVFAATQQISLGQANGDGVYSVIVIVNGCTSSPASYNFQKQTLVSSYTILAFDEIELGENNTVATGSVGVTSAWGEASFRRNSSVASPGSFVKAKYIDKNGPSINIANPVNSAATGITLPAMYLNTANTNNLSNATVNQYATATLTGNYKNLTLKKGSHTTLTGNIFGSIKVEQGAQVTFTAATINLDKLKIDKGPRNGYSYIRFAPNTKVIVSGSVAIGSQVYVNPDNNKVSFYLGDKKSDEERFSVKGGDTKITANIYIPNGKLNVTGGYRYGDYGNGYGDCDKDDDDDKYYGQGNSYVYMTGLFIAEEVKGNGKNVIWNSFDCGAPPVPVVTGASSIAKSITAEQTGGEEELKVTVLPNPSTTYFTLKLQSRYETPVNMRVLDAGGRVVEAKPGIGSNSTIQVGHTYNSGTYYAEMIQGTKRKVVRLVKAKG